MIIPEETIPAPVGIIPEVIHRAEIIPEAIPRAEIIPEAIPRAEIIPAPETAAARPLRDKTLQSSTFQVLLFLCSEEKILFDALLPARYAPKCPQCSRAGALRAKNPLNIMISEFIIYVILVYPAQVKAQSRTVHNRSRGFL